MGKHGKPESSSWPSYFFFFREFQLMAFALDDSFLSSDQDTNQVLV